MTRTVLIIVACAIQFVTVLVSYQYLTHRTGRKCQIREFLNFRYELAPLIAVLAALLASIFIFVMCFEWKNMNFMRALMNAEVMLWLSVIGYIDARERIIPNSFICAALIFWLILILTDIFIGGTPWLQLLMFSGIGGIACGGLLLIISLIGKSALGMGDVKMFFVLGLLYGLMDTYGILFLSVIAMGIVSIVLLIAKKVTTKTTIPMAPFVILGFLLSVLAGM